MAERYLPVATSRDSSRKPRNCLSNDPRNYRDKKNLKNFLSTVAATVPEILLSEAAAASVKITELLRNFHIKNEDLMGYKY